MQHCRAMVKDYNSSPACEATLHSMQQFLHEMHHCRAMLQEFIASVWGRGSYNATIYEFFDAQLLCIELRPTFKMSKMKFFDAQKKFKSMSCV
jgi:hypothetical protein